MQEELKKQLQETLYQVADPMGRISIKDAISFIDQNFIGKEATIKDIERLGNDITLSKKSAFNKLLGLIK